MMEKGSNSSQFAEAGITLKKYHVPPTYKGKNPMTKTQWRRFQRNKKAAREAAFKVAPSKGERVHKEVHLRPAKERLSMTVVSAPPAKVKNPGDDNMDDELFDDFEVSSDDELIIHCNIVSVLPNEYDFASEASGDKEEAMCEESADQKPLCYYVMNNGVAKEKQVMFEKPTSNMIYHLKPLFIRSKVDGFPMNNVFLDGGAAMNLMP